MSDLLLSPIPTNVPVRQGGVLSNRVTYSVGNYGISEFGNVRLAVEGKPFSERSSGSLLLDSKSNKVSKRFGVTGFGKRRFEYKGIMGGSSCKFGGLSFDLVHGKLRLLDDSFPVADKPTLIVVDSKGEIDAVVHYMNTRQ